MSVTERGEYFVVQVPAQSLESASAVTEDLNLQYGEYGGRVAELVLVLLNPDVVRAVVDVDGPVLRAQPHGRLSTFNFQFSFKIQKY